MKPFSSSTVASFGLEMAYSSLPSVARISRSQQALGRSDIPFPQTQQCSLEKREKDGPLDARS